MRLGLMAAVLVSLGALLLEFVRDGGGHALALALWLLWPMAMLWTSTSLNRAVGFSGDYARARLRTARSLHIAGWLLLAVMLATMLSSGP